MLIILDKIRNLLLSILLNLLAHAGVGERGDLGGTISDWIPSSLLVGSIGMGQLAESL